MLSKNEQKMSICPREIVANKLYSLEIAIPNIEIFNMSHCFANNIVGVQESMPKDDITSALPDELGTSSDEGNNMLGIVVTGDKPCS